MKIIFTAILGFLGAILPFTSSAQGDQEPWMDWSGWSGDATYSHVQGELDPQTAMPTTFIVEHNYYYYGTNPWFFDTSFVVNDLAFAFTIDSLEPNTHYRSRITTTNAYGTTVWNYDWITDLVGITEVEGQRLRLFPNPMQNEFSIENAEISMPITIVNLMGTSVYAGTVASQKEILSVKDFSAGMYILTIGNIKKRIVKE